MCAAAALPTLCAGRASAQTASEQAAAEALFKQGRDLMGAGQLADACPKFAESERLDPAPGTLLNLAACYERSGQIASAWVTYKEAATLARKADQVDRARLARDKAAELEPKLPMLTIVVPQGSDRPDLELRRDGQMVGRPEWGVPIPVDPGAHVVDAVAPGHKAWQGKAQVVGPSVKQSIEVPPLEALPPSTGPEAVAPAALSAAPATGAPPPSAPPPAGQPSPAPAAAPPQEVSNAPGGQRTAAWVVGGVGLAGLVAGGALGIVAASDHASSEGNCVAAGSGVVCNKTGYSRAVDAEHMATGSTIALAAGGALVVVAAVLYWTSPPRRTGASLQVAPVVGMRAAGLAIEGSW
jgi:serine/threonine-protein kinase